MSAEYFADFLSELPLGDKGKPGTLRHLAFIIGESIYAAAKNAAKDKVVTILSEYYCAPNRFEEIWGKLTEAERQITSLHIWGQACEPISYADEVAEKFGVNPKSLQDYYLYPRNGLDKYKEKYADKNSGLWLLFPKSYGNRLFNDELRETIGEMQRTYSTVSPQPVFFTRENRATDFANIVRFCNSNPNKLTVTKNGIISKPSALKLRDFCGYAEVTSYINTKPEEVRTADSLLVTFPLSTFAIVGGLLNVAEGKLIPGTNALTFSELPYEKLIKKLFEAYVKSKNFDEISAIKGIKAKRGHQPFRARQNLAEELKHCLPGQAIYTSEFEQYLRLTARNFARKEARYVVENGTNNYYDYGVEWDQYEYPLINLILSFFGALGIIDIAWGEATDSYTESGLIIPTAFRINPLGAYVLGLSNSYRPPAAPKLKIQGGFTVLPDYTVVIPDSLNRLKHELYFERRFSKISATDEVSIYKLDFETIGRTIDSGESVADLRKYLAFSDKPIPENVARALDDWERQAERIRIRQVTILECDDAALLEEVIRYKGMGELVKDKIPAAIVVDSGSTHKIKKIIEKNKRFCKDVI